MENNCEAKPKPKTVKEFFTSWYFWRPFTSVFVGGVAGFLYYYFVGCSSGTCAITSNPYMSILFGGFLGYFWSTALAAEVNVKLISQFNNVPIC